MDILFLLGIVLLLTGVFYLILSNFIKEDKVNLFISVSVSIVLVFFFKSANFNYADFFSNFFKVVVSSVVIYAIFYFFENVKTNYNKEKEDDINLVDKKYVRVVFSIIFLFLVVSFIYSFFFPFRIFDILFKVFLLGLALYIVYLFIKK